MADQHIIYNDKITLPPWPQIDTFIDRLAQLGNHFIGYLRSVAEAGKEWKVLLNTACENHQRVIYFGPEMRGMILVGLVEPYFLPGHGMHPGSRPDMYEL